MAVPTLTACVPSTVFTGGQFVTLTGTNFRLPYPVADGGPLPVPPPTVSVKFGTFEATHVAVFSSTELKCIAPAHDPGAVSITVQNLDVDGDPIVGESVTIAGLVTYKRVDLSVEDDFTRVTRALAELLMQQVIEEVTIAPSTDFSDRDGETAFNVVHIAKVPCLVLGLPITKANHFYEEITPIHQIDSDSYEQRAYMRTCDLTWKISGYDNNPMRAMNLMGLTQRVLDANVYLMMDRDPADPSKGQVSYELDGGDLSFAGGPNNSDVRMFSGEIVLKGFTFEDYAGMPRSQVTRESGTADTIQIETGPLEGPADETQEV